MSESKRDKFLGGSSDFWDGATIGLLLGIVLFRVLVPLIHRLIS